MEGDLGKRDLVVKAARRLRSWGSENVGGLTMMTMMMTEDVIWVFQMLRSVSHAIWAPPHFTWTTLSWDTKTEVQRG